MVDIAQLVSASDCGSEGRGFESHYPPHKKNRYPSGICSFYLGGYGIRRARPTPKGWVKNMPVACFLARGRIHGYPDASCKDVDGYPFFGSSPLDVSSFSLGGYGIRKINADVRGTSACRRSRRWQHLNFRQRRKCKRIPLSTPYSNNNPSVSFAASSLYTREP